MGSFISVHPVRSRHLSAQGNPSYPSEHSRRVNKKEVAAELRACSWIVAAVSIDTLREDFDFLEHSTQIRPDGQRWLTTDPL